MNKLEEIIKETALIILPQDSLETKCKILTTFAGKVLKPAQQLSKIYFRIACDAIGETEVRRKRDEMIEYEKNQ